MESGQPGKPDLTSQAKGTEVALCHALPVARGAARVARHVRRRLHRVIPAQHDVAGPNPMVLSDRSLSLADPPVARAGRSGRRQNSSNLIVGDSGKPRLAGSEDGAVMVPKRVIRACERQNAASSGVAKQAAIRLRFWVV
jgi:hypothetical protein